MRLVGVVVGVLLLAGGCTGEAASGGSATPPATSASTPASVTPSPSVAETAAVSPIDGVWGLRQSKDDIRKHLTEHGYGDRVGEFFEAEQIWDVDQWEWSFDKGSFRARWLGPDGAWKVADYGTFTTGPETVTLTFAEGDPGSSTTFGYTVDGDKLHLDWQSHDGSGEVKGFPDEAFWRAYLTAPLTRVS